MAYFAGIVWSQFVSDFKNKHTVAKPFSLAKREWLVGENPTRNDSVTVVRNLPTLRRSPSRELGCTPLIAPSLGPRRGDKPQCSLNPSHKDTYFQWNCKFSNGIVNFWNSSNSGRKGFSTFFFLIHRARGCRKPWCKNHGRGITGRCPSKIFLFSFIKNAVLNGKTAHTKGCPENRCEI